jgi:hypothetical protein
MFPPRFPVPVGFVEALSYRLAITGRIRGSLILSLSDNWTARPARRLVQTISDLRATYDNEFFTSRK